MKTEHIKAWIERMQMQGAKPETLTVGQYAIHLWLVGGGR